ncbi:Nif3-like dinuclear metal center hexameric protein [Archaeoglobus neptunius]|uniref:Nif3-like dinuclear metal center hexameric protein n=1 Tax=Archaeoglobus neptunius TaxID=2798580 RepID=UPI001926FC6D|nr:Nif3-like dinuclear metal center hexameric protein [Archaeoglobus neptunius]
MRLSEVCEFLDGYLKIELYQDVSNNGLQVEGRDEVRKVAFAVDACMETFRAAKKSGADMLVVHHGLIWGGIDSLRGVMKRRVSYLLENEISLYAVHLPLDAHREVGNNAVLLRKIGAEPESEFGEYRGVKIGYSAELSDATTPSNIAARFPSAMLLPFGKERVRRVAVVSGRGGFAIKEAIECGIELFITGEAEHEVYHIAKEGGVNVIFLGHYESERYGVESLMNVVGEKLKVETAFIDVPTNL